MDSSKLQVKFLELMESGNGIYWISGKAGSGKSTLIKFLCDHERTYEALHKWADPQEIVISSFFFYSAGNTMQKSQEGLLQSLLYQIFRQCPSLIPTICANRCKDTTFASDLDPWTRQELCQALENLGKQNDLHAKFFFFVDGLDEYVGEHIDIVQILKKFAESPNFKLCVSSRPWNVFVDNFDGNFERKLVLQDFTREDITLYVKNKLQEDTRFLRLMSQDDRYKYLVVRSLLSGLVEDDDIATLQLRLDHLPPDLDKYFKQMLETIEDVYQKETAQIFLLTVHATSPLSAIAFSLLQKEKEDPDYALKADIGPFTDQELSSIPGKVRKHLNARCKDLLEVNMNTAEGDIFLRYRVNFLHRTVRDFLMTQDIYDLLQRRAPAKFDVRLSLGRIHLRQIKALNLSKDNSPADGRLCNLDSLVHEMMQYAYEREQYSELAEVALLEELNRVLSVLAASVQTPIQTVSSILENYSGEKFLATVTKAGLHLYVAQKLDNQPQLLSGVHEVPLLGLTLQPLTPHADVQTSLKKEFEVDVDMIRVLLERGANPNEKLPRTTMYVGPRYTIWEEFLRQCFLKREEYSIDPPKQLYETAKMFLRHGADPDLDCETHQTEQVRRSRKWGSERSVTVVEQHYAKPATISRAVLRPSEYTQIATLLAERRVAKRATSSTSIWKWVRVK